MELGQWADLITGVLGSKEAVQAFLQGTEYVMLRTNTSLWSHFCGSIRRKREGIPNASWEAIGGVAYNRYTKQLTNDMDQVPNELSQRALTIAKSLAIPGRLPEFDQKVFDKSYTYRVVAAGDRQAHLFAFYRRPKYWILP